MSSTPDAGADGDTGPPLDAPWLAAPESRVVLAALTRDGRPARFVGGCVRDALLDPKADADDLDVATAEPPERAMALLAAAGCRVIPTGLAHGTVTALVGRRRYEVTTLRRDVATDGRHAVVAFTDDFEADAARRDFTVNAMSCDAEGRVFDTFAGRADLAAGRIRFVGDPWRRIREDYLRILRFFRFFARLGRPPADPAGLAACAELAPGLARLSGERVQAELLKLLGHRGAVAALTLMRDAGVLRQLLPEPVALDGLRRLIEAYPDSDPLLRLAALVRGAGGESEALAARLKLATRDARRLRALATGELPRPDLDATSHRRNIYSVGSDTYADVLKLSESFNGGDAAAALALRAAWQPPTFPVSGADLEARGVPPGPSFGALLRGLREAWIASDFTLERAALLERLERALAARRSP